ncbi:unnamed protein product [Amoebophrya sp. A120]|nr:unnamed protein product [Amoebophrya sp. A120]|eukprot:GSA120T00014246001.1
MLTMLNVSSSRTHVRLLLRCRATRTTRTGSAAGTTAKISKRNKLHAFHFSYSLLAPCLLFILFFRCFLFLVEKKNSSSYFHLPLVHAAFSLEPFFNPLCLPERGGGCDESSATYEISRTNTATETLRSCDTQCRAISGCVAFGIVPMATHNINCIFYRAGCQVDPTLATTSALQAGNHDYPYYTLQRNEAQCIDQQETPLLDSDANCPGVAKGCKEWRDKRVGFYSDRVYSKEECRYLCAMTDGCTTFTTRTDRTEGWCDLFSAGCTEESGSHWQEHSLDQCQLKGRVCPAVWGGACNEFNSLAIGGSDIATVAQTNIADSKITDYDLFCRGRGYDNNCVAMFRNQNTGSAMYFVDGCTQSSAAGWQHWSMAQNQAKCKAYVPRVDGTSCPSTFQGACANMNDKQLGSGIYYNDRVYSVAECRYQCANTPNCGGFFTRDNGECWLFQDGCTPSVNPAFTYYRLSDCNLLAEPMVGTLVSVRALSATFSGAASGTAAQVLLRPEYDFSSRGGSGTDIIAADISVCLKLQRGGLSRQFWAAEFRDGALHYVSGFMIFRRGDNDACKYNFQSYASLEYYDENGALVEAPTAVMTIFMAAEGVWVPVNKWLHKLQIAGATYGPGLDAGLCWCGVWIYEDLSVTSTTTTTPAPPAIPGVLGTRTAGKFPFRPDQITNVPFGGTDPSSTCWRGAGIDPDTITAESFGTITVSVPNPSNAQQDSKTFDPNWPLNGKDPIEGLMGSGLPFFMRIANFQLKSGGCWLSKSGDPVPSFLLKLSPAKKLASLRLYNFRAGVEPVKSLWYKNAYVEICAAGSGVGSAPCLVGTGHQVGSLDPSESNRVPGPLENLYDDNYRFVDIPLTEIPSLNQAESVRIAWDQSRLGQATTEQIAVCGIQVLEDVAADLLSTSGVANKEDLYEASKYTHEIFRWSQAPLYRNGPPFSDDFDLLQYVTTFSYTQKVVAIRVYIDWKDQGWGESKGSLQIKRMTADGIYSNNLVRIEPAPKTRERQVHVITGCDGWMPHTDPNGVSTGSLNFLNKLGAKGTTENVALEFRLGAGAGHVLQVFDLQIDALVPSRRSRALSEQDRALEEGKINKQGGSRDGTTSGTPLARPGGPPSSLSSQQKANNTASSSTAVPATVVNQEPQAGRRSRRVDEDRDNEQGKTNTKASMKGGTKSKGKGGPPSASAREQLSGVGKEEAGTSSASSFYGDGGGQEDRKLSMDQLPRGGMERRDEYEM